MKFHIVQVNEKIQDISQKYNVSIDEIKKMNRHINKIDHIVPGMKIRLPMLTEPVDNEIKDDFVDIEKYYPKIEDIKEAQIEPIQQEETEEKAEEIDTANTHNKEKAEAYPNQYNAKQPTYQQNPYYYYPQQPVPQNYYPYPQNYPQQPYSNQPYQQPQYPYQNQMRETKQQTTQNQPYQQSQYPHHQMTNQNQQGVQNQQPRRENSKQIKEPLYEQPALCDPILLEKANISRKENNKDFKVQHTSFYNDPLFKPPYPTEVTERPKRVFEEEGYDEEVKEIKADLRDFVRKHTKVSKKKKKDSLDIL